MLSFDKTLEYIRRAKNGDGNAKDILFKNNTPLIKSIVRRFTDKGVEYEDLYQIASMGFLKAILNFDEKFGVKFSTYCVPMVVGEIKRYMRDNGAIKVSRTLKILANKINKFCSEYQGKHDTSPDISEIAARFGVHEDEVIMALESVKMPLSIYDKFEDDDEDSRELIDTIPSRVEEEGIVDRIHLLSIIENMNEREKKIIILRYFRDKTQSEIAENLGVSQVQVSRLENKIIDKIREKYQS